MDNNEQYITVKDVITLLAMMGFDNLPWKGK